MGPAALATLVVRGALIRGPPSRIIIRVRKDEQQTFCPPVRWIGVHGTPNGRRAGGMKKAGRNPTRNPSAELILQRRRMHSQLARKLRVAAGAA